MSQVRNEILLLAGASTSAALSVVAGCLCTQNHQGPLIMSNQDLFLTYLRHYSQKNLAEVAALFADDIALRDWKIAVRGKSAAIAETRKNFESADTIEIHPLGIFENQDTVAAELKILVNGMIELHVMDVITFNPNGKIQSIRAYLGRSDLQTAP